MRNLGCDQDVVFVRVLSAWVPVLREWIKSAQARGYWQGADIYDPNESLSEEKEAA